MKIGETVFMNKILVVAKNKETYFIKRLTQELGTEKLSFFNPWEEELGDRKFSKVLVRTTGVYGGSADLVLLRTLPSDITVVNPIESLALLRNKNLQYQCFASLGIPLLPWLNLETASLAELQSFLANLQDEQFLIKPLRGQGGWGIRVFAPSELEDWFKKHDDHEYLVQPYRAAAEFRFFFIKEWGVTLKRIQSPGKVQANFQQQGQAELTFDRPEMKKIVDIIRGHISLDYGAADFLLLQEGPVLLEMNAVPGVEQVESIIGPVLPRLVSCLF